MTTSEEINALKEQKKEIEKRIRELENDKWIHCGCASIRLEHYPTNLPDRWYLAIRLDNSKYQYQKSGRSSWRTVVSASSKSDVIESIPSIIHDLSELYERAKERDNGKESQTVGNSL